MFLKFRMPCMAIYDGSIEVPEDEVFSDGVIDAEKLKDYINEHSADIDNDGNYEWLEDYDLDNADIETIISENSLEKEAS